MKKQGLSALYTGIRANFLLCLNPAIKHAVFDQVLEPPVLLYPTPGLRPVCRFVLPMVNVRLWGHTPALQNVPTFLMF